jgi:predicted permease
MARLRWLDVIRLRIRSLADARAADRDLDDELRFHLDQATAEHMARGLPADEARRLARLALGGLERRREECRDARGLGRLRNAARDVLVAARMLGRRPSFSLVAAATLALGIGANTAMFAIVHGVLIQPLPFPEPDRLLLLSSSPIDPVFGVATGFVEETYRDFRRDTRLYDAVSVFATTPAVITGAGEPARVKLATVTGEFFDVLRVRPALGRTFLPGRDDPITGRLLVIGDALWRSRFGAANDAVGGFVALDGVDHEVIGVMPPGFSFPDDADGWILLDVRPQGGNRYIRPVVGRLKPGVAREKAERELDALTRPTGVDHATWRVEALPLKERLVGPVRLPLLVLTGTVAFVLLIACVNVANLFMIESGKRESEFVLRSALGAGRWRLVQLRLAESLLLAAAGAAAGVLLAVLVTRALLSLAPAGTIPRTDLIRVDGPVLAVTCLLSFVTALGCGLVPALQATRVSVPNLSATRGATRPRERLHGLLVVMEIALSLILLAGAGLMLQSFLRLRAVDTGFESDRVLTATVDLPGASYRAPEDARRYYADALAALRNVPDVESVGLVNWLPFGDMSISGDFALDPAEPQPRGFDVDKPAASAGYFQAMGIQVLRGRTFTDADGPTAEPAAVVSQSAAEALWPGEDPLGKRINLRPSEQTWLTVVGVVDDVRQQTLTADKGRAVYQSYGQVTRLPFLNHATFVIRSSADPAILGPRLRDAIRQADPDMPVPALVPLGDILGRHTAAPAFQARVLTIFAAAALALTIVSLYAVLAYSVAQRSREFGIRMALGADRGTLMRCVLRQTLGLAGAGAAIGVAGALALTGVLRRQLFEVEPTDPATFAGVTLIVIAAALVAAAVPVWRAAHVDPALTLRAE